MVEFLSAAIWDRVCRYLRGRGLIFFPKFNTKTTITHLSWRAEEDELMMSEASFRALEAENTFVVITIINHYPTVFHLSVLPQPR